MRRQKNLFSDVIIEGRPQEKEAAEMMRLAAGFFPDAVMDGRLQGSTAGQYSPAVQPGSSALIIVFLKVIETPICGTGLLGYGAKNGTIETS